jgi:hypothetical protein
MSKLALQAAVEKARAARGEIAKQRAQQRRLTEQLEPARDALARAANELKDALGREQLGEASAADTKKTLTAQEAAYEKVVGIESGLEVLADRLAKLEKDAEALDRDARACAASLAAELEPGARDDVRSMAAAFAYELCRWQRLVSVAERVPVDGQLQERLHGCIEVLRQNGVLCPEIQVRESLVVLTPEQLLEFLPKTAEAAE